MRRSHLNEATSLHTKPINLISDSMEMLGIRKETYEGIVGAYDYVPWKLYESKSPVKKDFSDDSIDETEIKDSDIVVDDDVKPIPFSEIIKVDASRLNKSPTANWGENFKFPVSWYTLWN